MATRTPLPRVVTSVAGTFNTCAGYACVAEATLLMQRLACAWQGAGRGGDVLVWARGRRAFRPTHGSPHSGRGQTQSHGADRG